MQPGAHFAIDRELGYVANRDAANGDGSGDSVTVWLGHVGRTMDHAAIGVFDVMCREDRCATVYEAIERGTVLLEVTRDVEVTLFRNVPPRVRRVAITDERWYVASDAEVHVLAHRTDRDLELLALDALDIAASKSLLCVVEPRGVAWFDSDGSVVARRALTSPTAVTYDWLAEAWLVAADGDVLQLASPSADPVTFAHDVGIATRIRRDPDALYAANVDGELFEVLGIRNGPTTSKPRVIAAYAPGFSQFDARFELRVDEGNGPVHFYRYIPCKCRTRTIETLDEWSEYRSDNSREWFQRHRCPQCGHEWNQAYDG